MKNAGKYERRMRDCKEIKNEQIKLKNKKK